MSFLTFLKRKELDPSIRWIVKYDKNDFVREVKQIYKPSEYYASNKHKGKNARSLHNQNVLIKILENDKTRRN